MTAPLPKVPAGRQAEGWRVGKPQEDPEKTKRWGWVSAKPSEFLICMRGGKVTQSGQGATLFKWPWESVAVVPTTVQRLSFVADQVTAEKVGVQVTGIAVYRIADPLIAFRMLNFSYPQAAQEKLSAMMQEMCIGATRRLVANLTVEQCLTRRKDALGSELVKEVAPVVGGAGRVDDKTQRGWGVVIDSIEIQDVRVQSAAVFANMQARFRQELERQAREAELARERAVKQDEASSERQIELTRVAALTEVRRQRQTAEEAARLEKLASDARVEEARLAQENAAQKAKTDAERQWHLQKLRVEAEVRAQQQAAEEAAHLEQLSAEVRVTQARIRSQAEAEALKAEVEAAQHRAQLAAEAHAAEVLEARSRSALAQHQLAEIELHTAQLELHKRQLVTQLGLLDRAERLKAIDNAVSPQAVQLAVAHQLPALAAAFQQKMGEVHVTAIDGANPFGYVAAAVEGVLGLARSAGLTLPSPSGTAKKSD